MRRKGVVGFPEYCPLSAIGAGGEVEGSGEGSLAYGLAGPGAEFVRLRPRLLLRHPKYTLARASM
jgi:hypothetical protein